jgi:DNA repair exonuclease SbcCD ATPase subunit
LITYQESITQFKVTTRNLSADERLLWIEIPLEDPESEISGADQVIEKKSESCVVQAAIPAKASRKLTLESRRLIAQSIDLLTVKNVQVIEYRKKNLLSGEVAAQLDQLQKWSQESDALRDKINASNKKLKEIESNQQRLRENIRVLGGSDEEKQLKSQYIRQLQADETSMADLRVEIARYQADSDALNAKIKELRGQIRL